MSKKQNIKPRNVDGELHGLCIYYYDNGKVSSGRRFVNGIKHGLHEWYNNYGELWYKYYYNNGEMVYSEWYGSRNIIQFWI